MSPLAKSDGHVAPWLIDEFVPGKATVIDDVVVGFEYAVGGLCCKVLAWFESAKNYGITVTVH
jgi:hypothetical protein